MMNRRHFCSGLAGAAVAPAFALLQGCSQTEAKSGLARIQWDRELCTQCRMVLSDRRFAVQLQGGPDNGHWNFDDIGCAVLWLQARGWPEQPAPLIWVAALDSRGEPRWLDAHRAFYLAGRASPMGHNFGATDSLLAGGIGFRAMRAQVLLPRSSAA